MTWLQVFCCYLPVRAAGAVPVSAEELSVQISAYLLGWCKGELAACGQGIHLLCGWCSLRFLMSPKDLKPSEAPQWRGNRTKYNSPCEGPLEVICLLFPNSLFLLRTNGKALEMLQFLRTTSLIPVLEGLRQNWVSPYQPIRSVFKTDRSYFILSTLSEKFILLARPQLKLHHTPGPHPSRSTWNHDHKACSKPYQARAKQHTTAARALGWHSFLSWPAWPWGKIPQPAEKCSW